MTTRIFCYHEVEPAQAAAFARQLDFIQSRWARVAPLDAPALRDGTECAVLTFDDGDATVVECAQPLLDARGLRATIYVATAFIEQGHFHNGREQRRALSWEQLGRWVEAGHQIGSHTHSHANLLHCSRQQIVEELEQARELLRSRLGVRVRHFAYPWGQYDARVLGMVASAGGFLTAASIDRGRNDADAHPLALHRDLADPAMDAAGLRARLLFGSCGRLYRTLRRLRRRPVTALPAGARPRTAGALLTPPIGTAR